MIGRIGVKGTNGLGIARPYVSTFIYIGDHEYEAQFENAAELSEYIKDLVTRGSKSFGMSMWSNLSQRDLISRSSLKADLEDLIDKL